VSYRRILGLGTCPAVKPVHGGQRRVHAIKAFYQSVGIRYDHVCVYDPSIYGPGLVGSHDRPFDTVPAWYPSVPFITDLLSGRQAADDSALVAHFSDVLGALEPDALQLEHPFMWPLAERLLRGARGLPLIYSSHNVEAPLKRSILLGAAVRPEVCATIHDEIDRMEREVCARAALIICVSASDRDHYVSSCRASDVIVVPNGVDRPPANIRLDAKVGQVFGHRRFLFMVGSAYPPNVQGARDLVIRNGVFHSSPLKSLAVCGGVCELRQYPEYRQYMAANEARIAFFPSIDDDDLWALKAAAHGCVLAIGTGGGTSLKTAEALALGKWVVANSTALRGFEAFAAAEGVIRADNRADFAHAMAKVLRADPIQISEGSRKARDVLFWDRCFSDSGLVARLSF